MMIYFVCVCVHAYVWLAPGRNRYCVSHMKLLFVQFQKKTPFVVDTLGGGCHYIKPTKPITFKL